MLALVYIFAVGVFARCYDPSPAFPLPKLESDNTVLKETFEYIEHALLQERDRHQYNVSFSVEVTSSQETLWSTHYTKKVATQSEHRGVTVVDGKSLYRIASITKVFTTLGILYQQHAGKISLDDPVLDYLPELEKSQKFLLAWKDITIRTLASQLSGIPRNVVQQDMVNNPQFAAMLGLPPVHGVDLPQCDEYSGYEHPCKAKDLYEGLHDKAGIYAPNQKSTYSNDAFNLLGLVIEKVTGMSYSAYIKSSIFDTLGMNHSYLDHPKDSMGVIPSPPHYWDYEGGVMRPTGGIYSCASDLSRFLRYVLKHYNGLTNGAINWLHPGSYAEGLHSFYGMPWEIFRTEKILPSTKRPVTFTTKAGGVPGYRSIIIVAPEHDLGITILVAGDVDFIDAAREIVTVPLIRAADKIAMSQLEKNYAGTYVSTDSMLNSSVVFRTYGHSGLVLTKFISNGTDVLAVLREHGVGLPIGASSRLQLTPTLLFADQEHLAGEKWRLVPVADVADAPLHGIWDDFCNTDVDFEAYAGKALNEFVFWKGETDEIAEVTLSGYRLKLRKMKKDEALTVGQAPEGIIQMPQQLPLEGSDLL